LWAPQRGDPRENLEKWSKFDEIAPKNSRNLCIN
jgi:hypothetical protein